MDRETLSARAFGRPRLALDPTERGGLWIPSPGEATPFKINDPLTLSDVARAQEAHFQTQALLGIWAALETIAAKLPPAPETYRTGHPE